MKIKKFKHINEQNQEIDLFIFLFVSDSEYVGSSENPQLLIFDNHKNAINYLRNRMYQLYRYDENILKKLDNIDHVEDLVEYYDEMNDKDFYYYQEEIANENVELDEWIKLRLDSKKYNL